MIPETPIIAPVATEEQLRRYAEKGWIDRELAEHLDRAFPRNANGKPVIFRMWLRAAIRRACEVLGYPPEVRKKVLDFQIVDERGLPIGYIEIPDKPLVYRRIVFAKNKQTTETYEYIDSTYELRFRVAVPSDAVREFIEALSVAGRIGIMSRTKHGYGKFRAVCKLETS